VTTYLSKKHQKKIFQRSFRGETLHFVWSKVCSYLLRSWTAPIGSTCASHSVVDADGVSFIRYANFLAVHSQRVEGRPGASMPDVNIRVSLTHRILAVVPACSHAQ